VLGRKERNIFNGIFANKVRINAYDSKNCPHGIIIYNTIILKSAMNVNSKTERFIQSVYIKEQLSNMLGLLAENDGKIIYRQQNYYLKIQLVLINFMRKTSPFAHDWLTFAVYHSFFVQQEKCKEVRESHESIENIGESPYSVNGDHSAKRCKNRKGKGKKPFVSF